MMTGRSSNNHHLTDLFRKDRVAPNNTIPNQLIELVNQLGESVTIESLLNNHTFLPLYRPFLKRHEFEVLMQNIYDGQYKKAFMKLGLTARGVNKEIECLRICPLCVIEDKLFSGVPYLHRIHQVSIVSVCVKHNIVLTNIAAANKDSYKYIGDLNCSIYEEQVLDSKKNSVVDQRINRTIWQILNLPFSKEVSLETILEKYNECLWLKGYLTPKGKVRLQLLVDDMTKFYSNTTLSKQYFEFHRSLSDEWIGRVLRGDRQMRPEEHIFTIAFLATDFYSLLNVEESENVALGNPPWPCLNPACCNFLRSVIWNAAIRKNSDEVIATFECKCGFKYLKHSNSKNAVNKYAYDRVIKYGDVWQRRLEFYITHTDLPIRCIARSLNCDSKTINHHIGELKL